MLYIKSGENQLNKESIVLTLNLPIPSGSTARKQKFIQRCGEVLEYAFNNQPNVWVFLIGSPEFKEAKVEYGHPSKNEEQLTSLQTYMDALLSKFDNPDLNFKPYVEKS